MCLRTADARAIPRGERHERPPALHRLDARSADRSAAALRLQLFGRDDPRVARAAVARTSHALGHRCVARAGCDAGRRRTGRLSAKPSGGFTRWRGSLMLPWALRRWLFQARRSLRLMFDAGDHRPHQLHPAARPRLAAWGRGMIGEDELCPCRYLAPAVKRFEQSHLRDRAGDGAGLLLCLLPGRLLRQPRDRARLRPTLRRPQPHQPRIWLNKGTKFMGTGFSRTQQGISA